MKHLELPLTALLGTLLLSGCLSRQLRHPAQDHYVQTRTIADACASEGYGAGKCTQADLEAMVEQAKCIHTITEGEDCDAKEARK